MGGFNPITTAIGTLGSALSAGRTAYNAYDAANTGYRQAQRAYAQAEREIQSRLDLQNKQLALLAERDNTTRRDALRRAMAKQQAAFGAQGIDAADGSGQAVLLGLFRESDEERKYRERLDTLKRNALDQEAGNSRRRNLLDLQNDYYGARSRLVNTNYNPVLALFQDDKKESN